MEKNDNSGPGTNCKITRSLVVGNYFVHVMKSYSKGGNYQIAVRALGTAFPTMQTKSVGTPLPENKAILANFKNKQDIHIYTMNIKKRGQYIIETRRVRYTDPVCTLYDGSGKKLEKNEDGGPGRDCRIARKLKKGKYTVAIRMSGYSKGQYRVALHKPWTLFPFANQKIRYHENTVGIASNQKLLSVSTINFLRINIKQTGIYSIKTQNPFSSAYLRCHLLNSKKRFLASSPQRNRACRMQHFFIKGIYYIHITGRARYYPIKYAFAVLKQGQKFPAYHMQYPVLPIGKYMENTMPIKKGLQSYLLNIKKAGIYIIETKTKHHRTDPKCRLYNRFGRQIDFDDDRGTGRNCKISRTLSAGLYLIKVHSAWTSRGGYYRVAIRPLAAKLFPRIKAPKLTPPASRVPKATPPVHRAVHLTPPTIRRIKRTLPPIHRHSRRTHSPRHHKDILIPLLKELFLPPPKKPVKRK